MTPSMTMTVSKHLSAPIQFTVWFWTLINFFSILFIHPTPFANALNPIAVYGMAYTTINEDKLIIQGGIDYQTPILSNNVTQFMVLDLTLKSWETANAPWSNVDITYTLPSAFTTSFHSISVGPDRKVLTIWDSASPGSVTNFYLTEGNWKSLGVPSALQSSMKELKAATSPTGKVYIPLGDRGINMLIWDPTRLSITADAATEGAESPAAAPDPVSSEQMPPAVREGGIGYTWTWSTYNKTFILFGGRLGKDQKDPTAPYLHEFQPETGEWTVMNTKGVVVPRLMGSCMEPAYNGTKMILFGGLGVDSVATGSIYILDLPSMEWTQGPPVDALQNRSHMACGVSGDNFLVFGGIRRTDPNTIVKLAPTILIYNIYSKLWVTKFERGSHYIAPPLTSPTSTTPSQPIETTPTTPSPSGLSGGAIAGIAVGVLALFSVAGIVFLYCKRRRHQQSPIFNPRPDIRATPGSNNLRAVAESPSPKPKGSSRGGAHSNGPQIVGLNNQAEGSRTGRGSRAFKEEL